MMVLELGIMAPMHRPLMARMTAKKVILSATSWPINDSPPSNAAAIRICLWEKWRQRAPLLAEAMALVSPARAMMPPEMLAMFELPEPRDWM